MVSRRHAEWPAHNLNAAHGFRDDLRQIGVAIGVLRSGDVERHAVERERDVTSVTTSKAAHLDFVRDQPLTVVVYKNACHVAKHIAVR